MNRCCLAALLLVAAVAAGSGCNHAARRWREQPELAKSLDPQTRQKIEQGIVEPGFTPAMVYLALGRPSSPRGAQADAMRDGTWLYRDFNRNDRDYVRAGFRRRVVFDPVRKSDVIITEPVDPRLYPNLQEKTVEITFREGRVVDIQTSTL